MYIDENIKRKPNRAFSALKALLESSRVSVF